MILESLLIDNDILGKCIDPFSGFSAHKIQIKLSFKSSYYSTQEHCAFSDNLQLLIFSSVSRQYEIEKFNLDKVLLYENNTEHIEHVKQYF